MSKLSSWAAASALSCVLLSTVALAQAGHPLKGSWLGYFGPTAEQQHRMRLLFDWQGRALVGTINPGRGEVKMENVHIDYDTWAMRMEADLPDQNGKVERFVAVGMVDNLGSWTNRRFRGTYTFGPESGDFQFLIQ